MIVSVLVKASEGSCTGTAGVKDSLRLLSSKIKHLFLSDWTGIHNKALSLF